MNDRLRETAAAVALATVAAVCALVFPLPQWLGLLLTAAGALLPGLLRRRGIKPTAEMGQTEAFLQRIINIIPEPVYIKDADSRYKLVNLAFARQLNRTPEELIGLLPAQVFNSDEYGDMVRQEDMRILAGHNIMKEEQGPNPVTGEERYQLVAKEACADPHGEQVIIGTNFNITRWRIAERELQAAIGREREQRKRTQEFMQRFIDTMPEPIYIKDGNAHFLMVNEAFARERQMPAEELIGMTSFDLAPNIDTARMVADEDAEILRSRSSIFKEYVAHTPDTGEERIRHVHKRFCIDADGQPVIVGAHFDITSLRMAERTLQSAVKRETELRMRIQNYMQRLIDVIPQPVYVKDAESRYVMVNEAFASERLLPADKIVGSTPTDLGASEDHAQNVIDEDSSVLAGNIITKEESRPHPVTGQLRYRFISKRTCLDAEGKPVIVGANFDITAWREAEQAAASASAAKSLFLASMSHEIRTPLSGVIGTLRLALYDKSLGREAREYIETSLSNAESLLGIISDILDFSKIEAGRLSLEYIDFNLRDKVRDSVQIFRAHAASRSLSFSLDIAPTLPAFVRGDPTRIRQVLSNLVGNAVKFTESGSVSVRVEDGGMQEDKHRILFSVQDTGIGIPKEAIGRLFEKFQQADVSTTRRYGGTGLGLAICRQLVEAMGGQIIVESKEGDGTTFRFELLLEAGSAIASDEEAPLAAHSRKLRVLCAEDVPVNQLIIRTQLAHMGHEVDLVETGIAAIRALAEKDYDLVLMDGRMPEMDGADAARAIRDGGLPDVRVRNPQIRIVALTANASDDDRRQYLGAGMDDYLTKPVSEKQLHAVLQRTIQLQEEYDRHVTTIGVRRPEEPSLARVVSDFVSYIPENISLMDAAWEKRDLPTLAMLLHGISGRAENVGMDDMQDLAAVLGSAADRADLTALEREYPRLRGALESVQQCFEDV